MLILVEDNLLHVDSATDVLEHYGVKGMKWGKRLRSAVEGIKQAPRNIYNNHVENIKYSYRKKGLSEEEVEAKTKKRLRNEKIALAAAGTAVAAGVAYKLRSDYNDKYVDSVIKKGTKFQTIGDMDKLDKSRIFFGSDTASDKMRYKGLYGAQRYLEGHRDNVVETVVKKDIKVPSKDKAASVFKKLYDSDPEFRSGVKKSVEDFTKGHGSKNPFNFARNNMLDSILKDNKNADKFTQYDAFNAGLVSRNPDAIKQQRKFYKALKKLGYSTLVDTHDKDFSGMGASSPKIIFNGAKVLKDAGSRKLKGLEIAGNAAAAGAINIAKNPATYGIAGALAAASHAGNKKIRKSDTSYQRKYKNTK